MLQHTMTKRKTLIIACFGIVLGLCIGTALKNYRALEIVKRCSIKSTNLKTPNEIIGLDDEDTIHNSQRNLVFVGVMTAKNFLEGRARAVYDTWGKEVPGRIAFFSSEGSYSDELPVVGLKNVDDRYPPQKKSFMMLYYMYEHYIDRFEWFIRADDDVYMEPDKLERFLRSINSSKPQFIGQAGKGNSEEFGLLSLEFDENFCMGGPGVILSSETLRRVAPHIPTCLKNLYSTHEDVEVGRCVQKFAGIPCTWNYEMQYILRHNSSGRNAYTGKLKRKEIHNAITLHPIKQAPLMYRLHSYIQGLKAEELRQESLLLHRDIKRMSKYLEIPDEATYMVPSISPDGETSKRHFEDHNILENETLDEDELLLDEFLSEGTRANVGNTTDVYTKIQNLKLPILKSNTDVLKFWNEKQNTDREVYELSKICFAIPPTPVTIERAFSALKMVLTDYRSRLSQEVLENILLVKLNSSFLEAAIDTLPLFQDEDEEGDNSL